jgi:acetyl coenzyme A synthetase (ADP forming)-like protein
MMEKFFSPKSVAVIGASHIPGKIGYVIFENLVRKFGGKVYAVNINTIPILDREVFPSVKKIPDEVDLAIIVIPAQFVPRVLKECVEKKIGAVIIISAGFSESGEAGRKIEEECRRVVGKSRTRVMGPNCIGILDNSSNIDTLFLSEHRLGRPTKGNIAFVSQSGAFGSTVLDCLAEERIGISKFISYGNAMDLNECDFIEYLATDKDTKVITLYLEAVKDGKRFIQTAKRISKSKPIILLKAGKTAAGTKAVASHTASLAGEYRVYSSVFKQTGIIEGASWEEIFDFAKAFSKQPLPTGRNVMIITDGGGFGVLASDECERLGLLLPEPTDEMKKRLRKMFPSHVILHNPIDLTGDATAERYATALEECLKSKQYNGVILITLFQIPTLEEKIVEMISELAKKHGKPVLCCAAGGRFTARLSERLEANGIPVYPTPERVVKAFAALARYSEWLKKSPRG